jgi:hypothetical protein
VSKTVNIDGLAGQFDSPQQYQEVSSQRQLKLLLLMRIIRITMLGSVATCNRLNGFIQKTP